jgi:Tol biopolymer transport system component
VSRPLEPAASLQTLDPAHQGRTPHWSLDGWHIVFEFSRAGEYALFLANVVPGTPPVQLKVTGYWGQHAKFFADGTQLVFTALQQPDEQGKGARRIAVIDISAYLT